MTRFFLLIAGLTMGLGSLAGQHYVLDGLTVINCDSTPQRYTLDTDLPNLTTTWTVSPTMGVTILGSTATTITLQFWASGLYTLVSTSFSPNNQVLTDSLFILVNLNPVQYEVGGCYELTPGKDCYRVCAHSVSTIYISHSNELSVSGADDYEIINNSLIEITWGSGGYGEVVIYNACEVRLCFEILPEPIADFTTDPAPADDTLVICQGQEVVFQNSSANGLSYQWDFDDGHQSTSFETSHAFQDAGTYIVSLTASGICGCASTKQRIIRVLPSPAPSLDCVNSVCPETRQRYTATTNGCADFFWSVSSNGTVVEGGGPHDDFIEVIWHQGPDGFIDLMVDACAESYCSFVTRFRIPIITPDGPITGDASVCSGEITTYEVPYFPGTSYQWQVGNFGTILKGQNTHVITVHWDEVTLATPTSVQVDYENCFLECGGHDFLLIRITPEIRITAAQQVCQDGTASASAMAGFVSPSPVNVSWHLENEAGIIVFAQPGLSDGWVHTFSYPPGNYFWVAENSSSAYCNEIARWPIQVTALPDPPLRILGPQIICPGTLYGFTIDAAGSYGTVWKITDGASTYTNYGQTCQHAFGINPPYKVEAYHTDLQYVACASGPVSMDLSTAGGYTLSGPADVCYHTIHSYSFPEIAGAAYTWEIIPADHGEIRRGQSNTAEVYWTAIGPATIRLLACGVIIDLPVEVHAPPVFNLLGPTAACINTPVVLSTDQQAFQHAWFDENNNSLGTVNSLSLFPGQYGIALTDSLGCVAEKTFEITSYPAPQVTLTSASDYLYCNLIPPGVEIVANTDGSGYTYTWYQDGNPVAGSGPVFTVHDFSQYHVAVTNQYGCTAATPDIQYINCCPPDNCSLGGGGLPGGCVYIDHDFSISITGPECQIRQYVPQIANIEPGTSRWFVYSLSEGFIGIEDVDFLDFEYTLPGYYKILVISKLTGFPYSAGVCGHSQLLTDTIRAVADFKYEGACADSPVKFEDLTTFLPGESISAWTWNFGDPLSGSDNLSFMQDPDHLFSAPGDYTVELTITLASGCMSKKRLMVQVSGGPPLLPVHDPLYCEREAMPFSLPGNIFDIQWDFGDPVSGIQNNGTGDHALHAFASPGMYAVTVSARDVSGCQAHYSFSVDIHANTLNGVMDVVPGSTLCFGDTATLSAPPGGIRWDWSNGGVMAQIKVAETNLYDVLIYDSYACTYTPPAVFVSLLPKPEVSVKAREILGPGMYGPWQDSLHLCYGKEFELQAFGSGVASWQWVQGDITAILQFTDEGANLPDPGIQVYEVYAVNAAGCMSDTASIWVEIYPLPQVPVINLSAGSGCAYDQNTLVVVNPEAGVSYQWSDGQEGTMITASAEGNYFVLATSLAGCSRESNSLAIKPVAPVDQIPGGCFIKCDPLEVCLPPLQQIASYSLYENGVLIESGTTWPDHYQVTADGSYVFEVTMLNGCVAVSDPLDVMLYTGVGSVTVQVYFDTNGDGIISTGDALVPNIGVEILSDDGLHAGSTFTEGNGMFVFEDYPATQYTAFFDPQTFPSQYSVLIDSVQAIVVTCDDSVSVALLLTNNCITAGPDQYVDLCPGDMISIGDSTWTDTGTYVVHMPSVSGCDSVFTVFIALPDSIVIQATVWIDVDLNGILSPADTVIEGITVVLDHLINQAPVIQVTDAQGQVSGQYDAGLYSLYVDSLLLPAGLSVVHGSAMVDDTICGEAYFDFLLAPNCADVFLIQQDTLCPGDSIQVEGQWIDTPGTYSFDLGSPGGGCDTTLDVYIDLFPALPYTVWAAWNCIDLGSIVLTLAGNHSIMVDWPSLHQQDTVVLHLDEGIYPFTLTDEHGCTVVDEAEVTAAPALFFQLPPGGTVNPGDSVWLAITGDVHSAGLHYDWSAPGILRCDTCVATWVYPVSDTLLTVTITASDSCQYVLSTWLQVVEDSTVRDQLYIPNVFTPNGDGINDHWTMYSRMENTYVHHLTLYDRWGELLFKKEDFILSTFEGWDGKFRGKLLNPGVFVYVASLTLGDGRTARVKGDVTLVR